MENEKIEKSKKLAIEICDLISDLDIDKTDPFTISGLVDNLVDNIREIGIESNAFRSLLHTQDKEVKFAKESTKDEREIFYNAIHLIKIDAMRLKREINDL